MRGKNRGVNACRGLRNQQGKSIRINSFIVYIRTSGSQNTKQECRDNLTQVLTIQFMDMSSYISIDTRNTVTLLEKVVPSSTYQLID